MAQEYQPNGTEYFRPVEPLGTPGSSAKASLLAAAAALLMAAAAFFFPHVDCTPLDIQPTTALLETELFNLQEGQEVSWFLITGSGLEELPPLDTEDLTKLLDELTTILLTNLTPGTEYTIVFTTPGEDGEQTIVHTFTFRTPGDPPGDTLQEDPPAESTPSESETSETTLPPPTTEETTQPTEETTEGTTVPTTKPPAGGIGGGDDDIPPPPPPTDGGSSVVVQPPVAGSGTIGEFAATNLEELFDGQHNVSFQFTLNGNTVNSITLIVSREEYAGFNFGKAPDDKNLTKTYYPGEFYSDGEYAELDYDILNNYYGASLQAILNYTDVNGETKNLYSDSYTYAPTRLYDDPSANTASAKIEETGSDPIVRFKVNVNALAKGTTGFSVTDVQVSDGSGSYHVGVSGMNPSGPFDLEFTMPLSNFTSRNLELTIFGDSFVDMPLGIRSYTTVPVTIPEWSGSVAAFGAEDHPIGTTVGDMTCNKVTFGTSYADSLSGVPLGETVQINLHFIKGTPSSTKDYILGAIPVKSPSLMQAQTKEVKTTDSDAVLSLTFKMPGRNVVPSDFQFNFTDYGFSLMLLAEPPVEEIMMEETPEEAEEMAVPPVETPEAPLEETPPASEEEEPLMPPETPPETLASDEEEELPPEELPSDTPDT